MRQEGMSPQLLILPLPCAAAGWLRDLDFQFAEACCPTNGCRVHNVIVFLP